MQISDVIRFIEEELPQVSNSCGCEECVSRRDHRKDCVRFLQMLVNNRTKELQERRVSEHAINDLKNLVGMRDDEIAQLRRALSKAHEAAARRVMEAPIMFTMPRFDPPPPQFRRPEEVRLLREAAQLQLDKDHLVKRVAEAQALVATTVGEKEKLERELKLAKSLRSDREMQLMRELSAARRDFSVARDTVMRVERALEAAPVAKNTGVGPC